MLVVIVSSFFMFSNDLDFESLGRVKTLKEHINIKSIGLSIIIILAVRGLITMVDLPVTIRPHDNVGFTIKEGIGIQPLSVFEAAERHCQEQAKHAIRIDSISDSTRTNNQSISFTKHHFVCVSADY